MAKDPRAQLGEAIRAKRLGLRLSQEGLAERSGLHWTYIGGIERGERNIGILNVVKIARALETTASQLLAGIR